MCRLAGWAFLAPRFQEGLALVNLSLEGWVLGRKSLELVG